MTNASIKNVFTTLMVLTVSVTFSMGAFAIVAHAQDDLGYGDQYGDNLGYADQTGDNLGYADQYGDNLGYGDQYGDNLGYADQYGDNLGYGDVTPNVTDTWETTDTYGNTVTEENGVGYSYEDYSSPSYASNSYSQPFNFSTPSFPIVFTAPQQRPFVISQPVQQQQQQQQQQSGGQPINIVNNNVNTNTNVNSAPAVTTVTPIYQSSIQYPVQYVYPQTYTYPTYNYQNVYCTISASQTSAGYGQTVYLSWSAPGATSAYLSGVGQVNVNGSMPVAPSGSMTYTLTVQGYGGSNTCSTYVAVAGPSVSLSQIPYTGFDFGVFGDAMYWLALLAFAAAGAYLLIYYRGGMLAFAGATMARKAQAPAKKVETVVVATTAKKAEKATEPVRASLSDLPVFTSSRTSDTMSVVQSKGTAAPRIVISRN